MILFVDDEKRGMDSYRRELELSFPEVIFRSNVDEALRLIEKLQDEEDKVELLILDIMMPRGEAFKNQPDLGLRTGVHFYERIRKSLPDLPIIIFTNVKDEYIRERFETEKNCFFRKKEDYLPYELVEEVQGILRPKDPNSFIN